MFSQYYCDSELPFGVKRLRFDEVCDIKGGKRLPTDHELIDEPTNHPYIRVRDVGASKYLCLTDQFQYIDEDTFSSISRYIVQENDILLSIVGTIGLLGIVHSSLDNANLTENCVKLTNFRDGVSSDYIYHTLCYKKARREIDLLTVGAVQAKLPLYNIQSLPIIKPSEEELTCFQNEMDALDSQLRTNIIEMNKLQSLLQMVLIGLSD